MTAFFALLRRDLQLLLSDWRALAITFVLPAIISSITGMALSGMGSPKKGTSGPVIRLLAVDEDGTAGSRKLLARFAAVEGVEVRQLAADGDDDGDGTAEAAAGLVRAESLVRRGKYPAALIIPQGIGEQIEAGLFASFSGSATPVIRVLVDPSRSAEVGMLQGLLYRAAMEVVAGDAFSPTGGRKQFEQWERTLADPDNAGMPPELREAAKGFIKQGKAFFDATGEAQGDGNGADGAAPGAAAPGGGMPEPVRFEIQSISAAAVSGGGSPFSNYNSHAQAFAGMGVMFLLFGVLEGGLFLMRERNRGTLARIAASPTPVRTVLLAQMTTLVAVGVGQLTVMLLVARIFFGVQIHGSMLGLCGVVVAAAAAAAGFGLVIATLFKTEKQAQPVAILIILVTSALGGSWWPLFITPPWMQDLASITITKWAVGGLEAALWRGLPFSDMLPNIGILFAMAAVLTTIAWTKFRFD